MLFAIANYARLADELVGGEFALHVCWRDILPAREHDDFFLAVGDRDVALGVDLRDVAGVQPSVFVDRFFRLTVELVVALHHIWPAHEQLAVRRGLDFDMWKRASDAAHPRFSILKIARHYRPPLAEALPSAAPNPHR